MIFSLFLVILILQLASFVKSESNYLRKLTDEKLTKLKFSYRIKKTFLELVRIETDLVKLHELNIITPKETIDSVLKITFEYIAKGDYAKNPIAKYKFYLNDNKQEYVFPEGYGLTFLASVSTFNEQKPNKIDHSHTSKSLKKCNPVVSLAGKLVTIDLDGFTIHNGDELAIYMLPEK